MAKATVWITCEVCGKEHKVEKHCYNRAEADSFELWAAKNIDTCPECRKAARQEAYRAAAAKQAAKDRELGLVPLQGSEKQVNWATKIRAEARDLYLELVDSVKPDLTDEAKQYVADFMAGWEKVIKITSAKWWIDNRCDLDCDYRLVELMMEHGKNN